MTAPAPDRRHALMSRAHNAHQAELGLYAPEADRQERRRIAPRLASETQEVVARSALTRCALPGEPWSLNPYTGCAHDCVYCYVPDVAHLSRERYGSYVVVKRNLPTVLAKELKHKERRPVFLSSATDPYQPAEGVYEVTRRCLELLLRNDWPVHILTRNPLVLRDLDLITRFKEVSVGMSVPTLDDAARRVLEPGAPSIEGRLATLRALADAGLRPFVNLAPAYPFTGGIGPRDIAAAFKESGVTAVYAGRFRYLEGITVPLTEKVADTPYEDLPRAVQDRAQADRMMRAVAAACTREGLRFQGIG